MKLKLSVKVTNRVLCDRHLTTLAICTSPEPCACNGVVLQTGEQLRHLVQCNATVPPPAPVQMQHHVQMSSFPSSRTAPMLNVTCKKLHSLQA